MSHHLLVLDIQPVLFHPCLLESRLLPYQEDREGQVVQEVRGSLDFLLDQMAQEVQGDREDPSPRYTLKRPEETAPCFSSSLALTEH